MSEELPKPGQYVYWIVNLANVDWYRYGCVVQPNRETKPGSVRIQASNGCANMDVKKWGAIVVDDLPFDAVSCDQKATYGNWNHLEDKNGN